MRLAPLLAAAGFLALAAGALPAADDSLAPAIEAFREGRFEEAASLLREFGPAAPERPRARFLLGETLLLLDRPGEARAAFTEALALRPESVEARAGLGKALSALGEHEAAVEALETAVKGAPKDAPALRALGRARLAAGNVSGAVRTLQSARRLDRKDPLTAQALVEALLAADDLAGARSIAGKLTRALPDHPMGHFLSGLVHDRAGEDEEAIAAYERAIEKDERFLDAHKNLAILCHAKNPLYRDEERTSKALLHYERYFELGGTDEELRRVYLQMKSFLTR